MLNTDTITITSTLLKLIAEFKGAWRAFFGERGAKAERCGQHGQ
jgi:hypothetical protein